MELEPWLAESYENVDELTWKINLKMELHLQVEESLMVRLLKNV